MVETVVGAEDPAAAIGAAEAVVVGGLAATVAGADTATPEAGKP